MCRRCASLQEMEGEKRAAEEAARAAEAAEAAARRAQEELERKVYEESPLVARPFVSATGKATESEVALLTVQPSRPLIRMKIMRKRAEFGARYTFSDKESDGAGGCGGGGWRGGCCVDCAVWWLHCVCHWWRQGPQRSPVVLYPKTSHLPCWIGAIVARVQWPSSAGGELRSTLWSARRWMWPCKTAQGACVAVRTLLPRPHSAAR